MKRTIVPIKPQKLGIFGVMGDAGIIGLHMVSGVLVGGAAGYFLDRWLDTSPWLLLVFLLLGVVAGFLNVYRDTQRLLREQAAQDERHGQI